MENINEIFRVNSFVDSHGRTVEQLQPVDSITDVATFKYRGRVYAMVHPQLPPTPIDFEFPAEYNNVKLCFESFDKCLKDYIAEVQREQAKQNLIMSPNDAVDKGILKFPNK